MATPRSVEDASAEADRFLAELEAPAPVAEEPPVVEEAPAKSDDAPPKPAEDFGTKLALLEQELARERHRNDSLQGRLESQLRPANDTIRRLQAEIEELKSAQPQVPAHLRHLSKEEVESTGNATLEIQGRVARGAAEEVVASATKGLAKQLEEERQERERLTLQTTWAEIERQLPGAAVINQSDSDWHQFLETTDPFSGVSHRELASRALQEGHADRVVAIMSAYLNTLPDPPKEEDEGKSAAPAAPPVRPAPSAAPTPGTTPPAKTATVRESEIRKAYDDYTRGRYRGREEDWKKIEKEIDAAVAEGRVVPG
jgi:FtsZ-binding cell division protein ZapB